MRKLGLVTGMLLTAMVIASSARAATVNFWFANASDPTGTAISQVNVATGGVFNLSVWYSTDTAFGHSTWETMLGFDSSTGMGTAATALDGKIALNGTATTAVSNLNTNFPAKLAQVLAGGRSATGSRPYGLRISYAITTGNPLVTQTTPAKLYDVSLVNNMASGSYTMQIWNNPAAGSSYTSFLMDDLGATVRNGASLTVNTVNTVPEPGSLLALGTGLMGLAGFVVRRRK